MPDLSGKNALSTGPGRGGGTGAATERPARNQPVGELLDAFAAAAAGDVPDAFAALAGALWRDGASTSAAPAAAPLLLDRLGEVSADRQSRLVVLLGLLVDAEYPATGGPVATAVRAALDGLLARLTSGTADEPGTLALLYLLGHLPDERERILAAAGTLALADPDRSRLERSLASLDPDAPDLGRVWPAPSVWRLDDGEQEFDRSFIRGLSPAQVLTNWQNDTRMVRSYAGAKAYWAARHGAPVPVPATTAPGGAAPSLTPSGGPLARHGAILRCPDCRARLEIGGTVARCLGCGTTYPIANGILVLGSGVRDGDPDPDPTPDLLRKLADMPSMGLYYESVLRPSFLRLAGSNWAGAVTPADEDRFLATHLRSVDGPVLDLAAGAGRWTEVVAATVGTQHLIALDLALPMLNVLRRRLPDVAVVQASALALPFEDASLGAVNCWNALQAFPDDAATALREIGRCLRPGGTLTMMTFRWDADPIYRYFQASHFFPSRPAGMRLFALDEIWRWLADAGLRVVEQTCPETFVLITAERTPQPVTAARVPADRAAR